VAAQQLAAALDRRLLLIRSGDGNTWAWLGGRRQVDPETVIALASAEYPSATISIGEAGEGYAGWRLSHLQARAAMPVARRLAATVRYADVCLLSTALHDEVLRESLRLIYTEPLARDRDEGGILRSTLRAYFAAHGNASSAAAELGVHRDTVTARLRVAEERIGRPPASDAAACQLALEIEALR
jgi:DNA-binding PucR family transcriptional regulator